MSLGLPDCKTISHFLGEFILFKANFFLSKDEVLNRQFVILFSTSKSIYHQKSRNFLDQEKMLQKSSNLHNSIGLWILLSQPKRKCLDNLQIDLHSLPVLSFHPGYFTEEFQSKFHCFIIFPK